MKRKKYYIGTTVGFIILIIAALIGLSIKETSADTNKEEAIMVKEANQATTEPAGETEEETSCQTERIALEELTIIGSCGEMTKEEYQKYKEELEELKKHPREGEGVQEGVCD